MNTISKFLVVLAFLFGSSVASADSITYAFDGSIFLGAGPSYSPCPTPPYDCPVTGAFTFNSDGTFSDVVQLAATGQTLYASASPVGAFSSTSSFYGTSQGLKGIENVYSNATDYTSSNLTVFAGFGPHPFEFTSDGLPIVVNPLNDSYLQFSSNAGDAQSTITVIFFQVQPVPLPATAWLMLSGLAGVGWLGHRQRLTSALAAPAT